MAETRGTTAKARVRDTRANVGWCGQIGHKQDECPNRQQRVQAVQQAQQGQAQHQGPQTMGPIANPEPVHPNNVISPTSAGFTQVGSVPVNSVWMVGNVEAHYKPVATQNMFGAIESKDEDEEWPILKASEPQIVKKQGKKPFGSGLKQKKRRRSRRPRRKMS